MRPRISLRWFCATWMAAIAILGWWCFRLAQYQKAVQTLQNSGVEVEVHRTGIIRRCFPFLSAVDVDLCSIELNANLLDALARFNRINRLSITWDSRFKQEIGNVIARAGVKRLEIQNAEDNIFPIYDQFTTVSSLAFHGIRFNGSKMVELAALPSLEALDLSNSAIGDDNIHAISFMANLISLRVDGNPLTDNGIRSVKWSNLKKLETVSADCMSVSGESARYLVGVRLKEFRLFAHSRDPESGEPKYGSEFPSCEFKYTVLIEGGLEGVRDRHRTDDPFE